MIQIRKNRKVITFIGLLLLLSVFVIDILTPLGLAIYFFYLGIQLFFMVSGEKKFIVIVTIISAAFIVVAHFIDIVPKIDFSYLRILNRSVTIILIFVSMFAMLQLSTKKDLLKVLNELKIMNKELEAFNYISSHDLQEPLRKIQNFVSVLSEEKNLSDDGKYYLKELTRTSKKMRLLIEDLLQYSRIKKTNQKFEKTNLKTLFEEVIFDFKEIINQKKASIRIKEFCEASIIPTLFRQLIVNLISNSLKFSHPDRQPKIIIKGENDYGAKLNTTLSPHVKYCHISVIDNGIGFDPRFNTRIFDFFERLNGEKYPGTGLGLSICKKIIENHDGIITANGELNKGAQFDIYIPTDRETEKSKIM